MTIYDDVSPTRFRAQSTGRAGDRHRRARTSAASCSSSPTPTRSARSDIPSSTASSHRDARAELEAGRSGVRHYGPEGQTTPEDLVDTPVVQRVRRELGAAAADVDLRRRRLHGRPRQGRQGARLPRRRCATPARSSRPAAGSRWPTRCGSRGRARCSRSAAHTLGPRDAVCILTHDPKFDVPAVQGALATSGRVHRRDGQPHHARQAHGATRRGRRRRSRRPRPADVADRARHRRPHPGGDGDLDLRRDHRQPHRPLTPPASATAKAPSTPELAAFGSAKTTLLEWRPVRNVISTSLPRCRACTIASPMPRNIITWPG